VKRGARRYHRDVPAVTLGPEGRAARLRFMGDGSFARYLGRLDPDVDALFRVVAQRLTAPLEDLSAGSGLTVMAHAWSGGKSDQARNLRGGTNRLVDAIRQQLGERVVTGAPVAEVVAEGGVVRVGYTLGGREQVARARAVILATPAYVTSKIAPGLPRETLDALNAVRYGPFVVGAFLTDETGPMPWDRIYAVAVARRSINMLFNVVNITRGGERKPGGTLFGYGGGEAGTRLMSMTDDQVREAFTDDLYAIYPEARGHVKEFVMRRLPQGMPYVYPGRYKIQPALERDLGNVFLAGDYLDWAHMEASVISGTEAAAKARRLL